MPRTAEILERLDDEGVLTRRQFADATDLSTQATRRRYTDVELCYRELRMLIRRTRPDVAFAFIEDLTRGTGIISFRSPASVKLDHDHDGDVDTDDILTVCAESVETGGKQARAVIKACVDGKITADEELKLQAMLRSVIESAALLSRQVTEVAQRTEHRRRCRPLMTGVGR